MSDQNVATVVTRLLHAVDDLDWETVRELLADQVALDYTSLWGGTPQEITGNEVVAAWAPPRPGVDAPPPHTPPHRRTPPGPPRGTVHTTTTPPRTPPERLG